MAIGKHNLELLLEKSDCCLSSVWPWCPGTKRYWFDVVEGVKLVELCFVEVFVTADSFWVAIVIVNPFP